MPPRYEPGYSFPEPPVLRSSFPSTYIQLPMTQFSVTFHFSGPARSPTQLPSFLLLSFTFVLALLGLPLVPGACS